MLRGCMMAALLAVLLVVALLAGGPAGAQDEQASATAALEEERDLLRRLLALEGVYFINGLRYQRSGHVRRDYLWVPVTADQLSELYILQDNIDPVQDWRAHLRLLREDDRVLRATIRERLAAIDSELSAIPGSAARRAEQSERDFLMMQLSLNDVVFVNMRRYELLPGLYGARWVPVRVSDMASLMMLAAARDPGFDWVAEFRTLSDDHHAFLQAMRNRLAEMDAAQTAQASPAPVAEPPPAAAPFPPLHAGEPTDCGAKLDNDTRVAMRDALFANYEDGIWRAHSQWNDVRTHNVYGTLRDHIMSANYFSWHWEVNVPVWWARVRCASGCIMATPRPLTHEAGAAYRACLRSCEETIRFFSCGSDGVIARPGTVITH